MLVDMVEFKKKKKSVVRCPVFPSLFEGVGWEMITPQKDPVSYYYKEPHKFPKWKLLGNSPKVL